MKGRKTHTVVGRFLESELVKIHISRGQFIRNIGKVCLPQAEVVFRHHLHNILSKVKDPQAVVLMSGA